MALTKVSGGILDPGINVAGIVTATGFDGPFTGGSSRNITAGIITATGLDVNGNGDISGNLVVGGNLTANGDFTTLNTTLREVEILHVDADSSEPAGIITQTGAGDLLRLYDGTSQVVTVDDEGNVGIGSTIPSEKLDVVGVSSFTGDVFFKGAITSPAPRDMFWDYSAAELRFNDNANIFVGSNRDAFFSHDGSSTRLQDNYGHFFIGGNLIQIKSGNLSKEFIRMNSTDNTVKLYFNTTEQLSTVGYGITVFGTTETQKLNVTGISTFNDEVNVVQGKKINFGDTDGTKGHIYYDGSTTRFQTNQGLNIGAPVVSLKGAGLVGVMGEFIQNGAVQLYHNNNLRLETDASGIKVSRVGGAPQVAIAQTTTGAYSINGSISFVNGNNTTAQIQGRTGAASTTGDILFLCNTVGDETLAILEDGKVRVPDRGSLVVGQGNDLTLKHDGDHSTITNTTGNLTITNSGTSYSYIDSNFFRVRSPSNSFGHMIQVDASGANQGVKLFHAPGVAKLITTGIGVSVIGEVAASQDYPDLRPRLDFNFAAEKKLDPRIVYYRTGPASFTDELGKVVLVGDNTPRFDHDPLTGESKGLLMEITRTNLLSYSVPNSNWNLSHATITENAGIAPDGTNTAVLHSDNNTSNQHLLYTTATVSNATNYVITSYLKQPSSNSRRYYSMTIHGLGYVIFDVQNGTVHNSSGTGIQGATITAVGNGWYRVQTHYVTTSTTGNIYWLPIADDGTNVVYTGTSTAQGMLVWGCQLEQATYETSYIPTFGSTATRGSEHAVIDGEDFTDFYNTLESSVLAVGTIQRPVAAQGQLNIFHIGDNNEDGHGVFREHGTKDVWYHIRNNNSTPSGGNLNPNGFGDWDEGEEARIAIAFKDGDQAISVNGGNQITATVTSSYPTADITKMWIGSHGNGSYFEGHISRIAYYPKLLTDNQLNTLTA